VFLTRLAALNSAEPGQSGWPIPFKVLAGGLAFEDFAGIGKVQHGKIETFAGGALLSYL